MHYLCSLVMLDETMTSLWVLIVQSYFDLKVVLILSLLRYIDGHAPYFLQWKRDTGYLSKLVATVTVLQRVP